MLGETDELFQGYCFPYKDDSWHTPAVKLNGCKEAVQYANLQKVLFYEVRIVGEDEKVVLQTIERKIVFPVQEEKE